MYDFKAVEEKAAKIWAENEKEIKKTLEYNPKKPLFSFLEGPPTANAPPGLHHIEVRVFKDAVCRFKTMQGFSVPRKAGWDCHGLPVEVQIEKQLKLNSKKEILNYGVDNFIQKCRDSVFSYISDWNKMTSKMAYWTDLEHPYVTLENDYIESVWWSLKQIYGKKLLYEGHKVVPFCPRCETPLSSHEVAQGYKDVKDMTVTVKVKIKGQKRYFLVWTTTPWTLPSNLGLAVNGDMLYAVVKKDGEEYIVAKELAEKYFEDPEIVETVLGKKLIGKKYEPIFDYFSNLESKGAFKVIEGKDFVTSEEGTGIVHMAPAFGEVDYDACKRENMPFVQPVNSNGKFTGEIKEFEGKFVKSADSEIIHLLEKDEKLFKKEIYTHSYPFCWRCNTPLIYFALNSWFIKVSKFRDELVKQNKKINWYPNHIKEGRFGEWLANAKDWALSRFKFWGTPLPIWKCECGNEICIGSVKELKENAVSKVPEDLHRPQIDSVLIKCDKCAGTMKRVEDVIDCWYDSGSASFAQFHYPFENKELFKKRFPYDFISEAIDQTRGWFYTLHVLATILFDDVAYKNCVCAGHVVDEKGEKMSKTKGNIINPWEMFDQLGVDAVRLQMCVTDPGEPKRFGANLVKESVMPLLNILWNCSVFSQNLAKDIKKPKLSIEDEWIISKVNSLNSEFTESLEKNNYHLCYSLLKRFVEEDFSRFYIKTIRDRSEESAVAYTLNYIFDNVSRIIAPLAPYIGEALYQDAVKKKKKEKSVHFEKWPKVEKKEINEKLEKEMLDVQEILRVMLAEREKVKIGLKWPLASAEIVSKGLVRKELIELLEKQANIKKIAIREGDVYAVSLNTEMTPELEAEGYAREISRKIQAMRKNEGLKKENKIKLIIQADSDLTEMLKSQKEQLGEKVNATVFELTSDKIKSKEYKNLAEERIREKILKIGFCVTL